LRSLFHISFEDEGNLRAPDGKVFATNAHTRDPDVNKSYINVGGHYLCLPTLEISMKRGGVDEA